MHYQTRQAGSASHTNRNAAQTIDIEALRRHAATMPFQEESAGDFMRRIRDEERY